MLVKRLLKKDMAMGVVELKACLEAECKKEEEKNALKMEAGGNLNHN